MSGRGGNKVWTFEESSVGTCDNAALTRDGPELVVRRLLRVDSASSFDGLRLTFTGFGPQTPYTFFLRPQIIPDPREISVLQASAAC